MTSVWTGTSLSRCWVPVPVTTTSGIESRSSPSVCAQAVLRRKKAPKKKINLYFILLFILHNAEVSSVAGHRKAQTCGLWYEGRRGFKSWKHRADRSNLGRSSGSPRLARLPKLLLSDSMDGANLSKRITAAGTAPVFHRIPLHQAVRRDLISKFVLKGKHIPDFMLCLSDG